VQDEERTVEQARADETAATALMVGSSNPQLSRESDLTAEEVRAGAVFLRKVKQRFGAVSTENLGRVMANGLLAVDLAANHDSRTALPTSTVRPAGQSPAPDEQITGHSKPVPEPPNEAAIAAAAAAFISSRVTFAGEGATYGSYPATEVGRQSAENELTRHLRTALHGASPTPGTLNYVLGHCAQAATILIGGLDGERVSALIHGQALPLTTALASVQRIAAARAATVPCHWHTGHQVAKL
jgi:hypothetical protein